MLLAIDQGTTGTTCLVFDLEGELAGRAYREFAQHFPKPGWVEHDAAEIWDVTRAVAIEALEDAGVGEGELTAVGITNQRETVCVWDPATGEPLHRALVWQDRRTARRCEELKRAGHEAMVRDRTGLVLDPYFSGTKIEWLLRNVDGLRERARDGKAVFGTVDAWVVYNLTGEFATDATNASRTLLCDIHKGAWDGELLSMLGDIPERSLPEIRPSCGDFGTTRTTPCPASTACPSRAWPATSRRRWSARRASTPARARTRTARARSSCSTRATRCRPRQRACSPRSRCRWGSAR